VKPRLVVQIIVRSAVLARHPQIGETAAVREPGDHSEVGILDPFGKHSPAGGLDDVEHRTLRPALGEAEGHIFAVGRRAPPVENLGLLAPARRRIDQNALGALAVADQKARILRAGGTALIDDPGAGLSHPSDRRQCARAGADVGEQGRPAGHRVEKLAAMLGLAFQPRHPFGVLAALHPPIGVGDAGAVIIVGDGLFARDGRSGDSGHGQAQSQSK
jgi:hypothetical protein